MGRFKYLVDSPDSMESLRARYHIPLGVGLEYCPQIAYSQIGEEVKLSYR